MPTLNIQNQKPITFYEQPLTQLSAIDDSLDAYGFEIELLNKIDKSIASKLFQPINPNNPVSITEDGNALDASMIAQAIFYDWMDDYPDITSQTTLDELFRQSARHPLQNAWSYDKQTSIEAFSRMKLPLPSKGIKSVKYTAATDIIPAAKSLLAQTDDASAYEWTASLAGFLDNFNLNDSLYLTFQSSDAFDEFKDQLSTYASGLNNAPVDQIKFINDMQNVDIDKDMTSLIFLPGGGLSDQGQQGTYSFTKIMMNQLQVFESSNALAGDPKLIVPPLHLSEVYRPTSMTLINLEAYTHATPGQINRSWNNIEKAQRIRRTLRYVSTKKLQTSNNINSIMQPSSSASTRKKEMDAIYKRNSVPFGNRPQTSGQLILRMAKIIKSSITKHRSDNTYTTHKMTFMRPSRRDPDNINLKGKFKSKKYRPDIHIYLDTSGSISEDMYKDAIMNLIKLTSKIDTNLYFSSFSHYISETTRLETKGLSPKQTYQTFKQVDKAEGGTDFYNVWDKINLIDETNQKRNKAEQINFIITDFGFIPRNDERIDMNKASTKNTFYVPISMSQHEWSNLTSMAKDFKDAMVRTGDTTIRQRMLL